MKTIEFYKDDKGLPLFFLMVDKLDDYAVSARVYEVTCWNDDDTICDSELLFTIMVKWDGCSNLMFIDHTCIHLCGKRAWHDFVHMMTALYDVLTKEIKHYDSTVGG